MSIVYYFLARDPFVKANRRDIAMMFVGLAVCRSVRLSGTGVHCDHNALSADLSLWLDSPDPNPKACLPTLIRLFSVQPGRQVGYGCAN